MVIFSAQPDQEKKREPKTKKKMWNLYLITLAGSYEFALLSSSSASTNRLIESTLSRGEEISLAKVVQCQLGSRMALVIKEASKWWTQHNFSIEKFLITKKGVPTRADWLDCKRQVFESNVKETKRCQDHPTMLVIKNKSGPITQNHKRLRSCIIELRSDKESPDP